MIDNLDEAIKQYEHFAECETETARVLRNNGNEKDAKYFEETAENDKKIVVWLEELKQRREEDRWIPVSERLPEYSGLYLISVDDVVTVANFTGTYFMHTGGGRVGVYAWQPLPEPYKKGGNEE